MRKPSSGFLTRCDTNRAVQSQKMVRGLKFRIKEVEGLYYLCSENKGADQLRGYREADLHLCFRICKKPVFSQRGSNNLPILENVSRLFGVKQKSIKIHYFPGLMRLENHLKTNIVPAETALQCTDSKEMTYTVPYLIF